MYRELPAIVESLDDLENRFRRCRDDYQKPRLHLLVLFKRGEVRRRGDAAARLGYHRHTIGRWLHDYSQKGLEGLLYESPKGAPKGLRKLPEQALDRLAELLQDEQGLTSYKQAQQWLEAEYGQPIAYSTVHEWVRYRLKAKLKCPRPSHPKKTLPRAPNSASGSNARSIS
jgi:transposase